MNNLILEAAEKSKSISDRRFIKDNDGKKIKDEARATEKLMHLHGTINRCLRSFINNKYAIISYGEPCEKIVGKCELNGYELELSGFYKNKRVDIAVSTRKLETQLTPTGRISKNQIYKDYPMACILSKAVFANMSQNMTNYFDLMRGETSNLRKMGHIVGQLLIVANHPIYYNDNGVIKHTETFDCDAIIRYLKLYNEDPLVEMERPDAMCLIVVDIDNNGKMSTTLPKMLGFDLIEDAKDIEQYLELSDFNRFLMEFSQYVNKK